MVGAAALALAMVASSAPGWTAAGCARPPQPACAVADVTFLSADAMTQCQEEVRTYLDAMPPYQECLRQAQLRPGSASPEQIAGWAREQASAGAELVETARYFNCRLMGRQDCR